MRHNNEGGDVWLLRGDLVMQFLARNSVRVILGLSAGILFLAGCAMDPIFEKLPSKSLSAVSNTARVGDASGQSGGNGGNTPAAAPNPAPSEDPTDDDAVSCNRAGAVKICHVPPGNPAAKHTICVSPQGATHGHGLNLADPSQIGGHGGDRVGECNALPPALPPPAPPIPPSPQPDPQPSPTDPVPPPLVP
jgi:hypothetical protein